MQLSRFWLAAPVAALWAPFVLGGCTPQAASETAQVENAAQLHPVSGLEVVPLTVTSDGTSHRFEVEVARSSEAQARGLMFRTELGPNEGMIFPRNPPDIASFWMKNTPLPLDIIFVGTDGRIMNIAENTVPYSLEPVAAIGMTGLVFEIAGGRARELGIEPGDEVKLQD